MPMEVCFVLPSPFPHLSLFVFLASSSPLLSPFPVRSSSPTTRLWVISTSPLSISENAVLSLSQEWCSISLIVSFD